MKTVIATAPRRQAFAVGSLSLWLVLGSHGAMAQQCTVNAVSPVFGNYQGSSTGSNASGSISVSCITPTPQNVFYTVKLGLSGQSQGSQRRMNAGTNYLSYNVFCDASYSQIWTDGTAGSCVVTGGQASQLGTLLRVYPVYGRVPGGQFVAPGTYADTIPVQVLY